MAVNARFKDKKTDDIGSYGQCKLQVITHFSCHHNCGWIVCIIEENLLQGQRNEGPWTEINTVETEL